MHPSTLFKLLLLVLSSLSLTSAVTIRNYLRGNCAGNARVCTNVRERACCSHGTRRYSSSRFTGIITSELGIICDPNGGRKCGIIQSSNNGPNLCVTRAFSNVRSPHGGMTPSSRLLAGSYWVSCLTCRKRDPANQVIEQPAEAGDAVLHDKVIIDGHMFEINHPDQNQPVVEALDDLVEQDVTYADIPADLKKWEVPMTPEIQ